MGNLNAWEFCLCSSPLAKINWDHSSNAFFQNKEKATPKYYFFWTRHSLLEIHCQCVRWHLGLRGHWRRDWGQTSAEKNLFLAFERLVRKSPGFLKLEDSFHHEYSEILRLPRGVTQTIPRLHGGVGRIVQHDFFLQQFLDWYIRPREKTGRHSLNLWVCFFFFFPFHRVSFWDCR